jgi:hypothetical protein
MLQESSEVPSVRPPEPNPGSMGIKYRGPFSGDLAGLGFGHLVAPGPRQVRQYFLDTF